MDKYTEQEVVSALAELSDKTLLSYAYSMLKAAMENPETPRFLDQNLTMEVIRRRVAQNRLATLDVTSCSLSQPDLHDLNENL